MELNARALKLAESLLGRAAERRIAVHEIDGGGRFVDCGIAAPGGLGAGTDLARICLADLADVSIAAGDVGGRACPSVTVTTDHPVTACLASQYAGWAIKEGKFFAMGSGPMRAAAGSEAIFDKVGGREAAAVVVGVLETRTPPGPDVVGLIARSCGVAPASVLLLAAPTASLAGGVQVVARSVETALHKLVTLGFDVNRVVSAIGTAPLPPVARDDLAAIGRTNDAILYGARVVFHVRGDDATIEGVGPGVPSSASKDYGEPFAAIFARYHQDFYAVDSHLFSPAEVVFQNIETGRVHSYGRAAPEILTRSFFDA